MKLTNFTRRALIATATATAFAIPAQARCEHGRQNY